MKPDGSMRVRPTFYPEMKEREMSLMEFKVRLSKLSRKKKWHVCFIDRKRDGIYSMLVTNGEHGAYTPGWQMVTHDDLETSERDVLWKMYTSGAIVPCEWRYRKKTTEKKVRKVTLDDWL